MTTATNLGGRPRTTEGIALDRVMEMHAIALDLAPLDAAEFSAHTTLADLLKRADEAIEQGLKDTARHLLTRARGLQHQMREADLEENRRHRELIALGRGGEVPA